MNQSATSTIVSPGHWNQDSELAVCGQTSHGGRLTAMIDIARAAGDVTLEYFGKSDLVFESKSDDSPVTIADRNAEKKVREWVAERFPDDAVEGEEFENTAGKSDYRWVVDPIDGTKSFICGVPLYSTLLALQHGDDVIAGAILLPALDEILVAVTGCGAWHQRRGGDWVRAQVSKRDALKDVVFVTSQVDSFAERGSAKAYAELERSTRFTRTWGDGFGYVLLCTGQVDIMVDPMCKVWDVAAAMPVVLEAGGRFSDWHGRVTARSGDALGTNGVLHDRVLEILGS
ncbi:MAG: histidinol-phosphatase [Planctomycetota bacterium]